MNTQEFDKLVQETFGVAHNLLIVKGGEYAGSSDRLANFKRGAQLTGATPLQVAFVYASKHYDSISTYVKKDAAGLKQVLSEPIEGRLDDLINYCLLMKAIIQEQRYGAKQEVESTGNPTFSSHRYGAELGATDLASVGLRQGVQLQRESAVGAVVYPAERG
jgi:hypothetical protein